MGYLAQHFATNSPRPRTPGDILSMLANNRGHATVRVRLDAPSPNHDGLYWVDEADAQVIVSRGWGVLEP